MSTTEHIYVLAMICALAALVAAAAAVATWRAMRHELRELRVDVDRANIAINAVDMRVQQERDYVLRPRDLTAIHERINKLAEQLASSQAQMTTETRMLSEQLRVVQRLIQKG